jgi:hypothetical protein
MSMPKGRVVLEWDGMKWSLVTTGFGFGFAILNGLENRYPKCLLH